MHINNRRNWLKQTSLAIAGLSIGSSAFSLEKKYPGPPNSIRLNANENPYGPSPMARKAMADAVALSNRYPFSDLTGTVREKIASKFGLAKENVLLGAGSSEILGLVAQHAALQKGNAVTAGTTFGIWWTLVQQLGLNLVKVPLTADKKHDLPAMLNKINSDTKLVYVCNPNNPTATITDATTLKNFVEEVSKQTLVLLDEAYIEYTEEPTLAALVANNKNIIIAKTFSKIYGMAGARIGYALAHPDIIKRLGQLQPWENAGASRVSLAGAMASLEDIDFVRDAKKWNSEARNFTKNELEKLNIRVIPSYTNFMYFSLANYSKDYFSLLAANNITGGRMTEEDGKWSRITIGTMEEMKQYIKAIQ